MIRPPSDAQPELGHKHRILLAIEKFSRRRYGLVFALALVALVVGPWLGSRLSLESDVLAMIPVGNRQVDTLREALSDFGSIDYLMILLEAGPTQGADELEDFADAFAGHLSGHEDLIEHVEYRFELDPEFLELFYRNAVLFLPPDKLPELALRVGRRADHPAGLQDPGKVVRLFNSLLPCVKRGWSIPHAAVVCSRSRSPSFPTDSGS